MNRKKAHLVVQAGVKNLGMVQLEKKSLVLGRIPVADIGLENPFVSRSHAEIFVTDAGYFIRDLESSNGTFVDGRRIDKSPRSLVGGELIELGQGQVMLKFSMGLGTLTLPDTSAQRATDGDDAHQTITTDGVVINHLSRMVYVEGVSVSPPITGKDFEILAFLCESPGTARSKEEIAERGWPERPVGTVSDSEIGQRIHRIRQKIEPDPSNPKYIEAIRGFGYKLATD